jgi:hypothetical protein
LRGDAVNAGLQRWIDGLGGLRSESERKDNGEKGEAAGEASFESHG